MTLDLAQLRERFDAWYADFCPHDESDRKIALAAWSAAVTTERERCARLCEMRNDEIRLMAGELTPQEMRAVQAVLRNRAAAIRSGS